MELINMFKFFDIVVIIWYSLEVWLEFVFRGKINFIKTLGN